MDPNAALSRIHQLQVDLERAYNDTDESAMEAVELGRELSQAVASLDAWLANGGFLPSSWSNDKPRVSPMWSEPVIDCALNVEVDETLNIVLAIPAKPGMRRRQVTLSDVDRLHAQLEEARSFVRGTEREPEPVPAQGE